MSESHVFVRPATPADGAPIGLIHAETMLVSLRSAINGDLPLSIAAGINAEAFGQSWTHAIIAPPSPDYLVFTAVEDGVVVGFTCVVPTEIEIEEDSDIFEGNPPVTAEITAFEVAPNYQRRGHGSRLLAALVDSCRERGVEQIQAWTLVADESRTGFFSSAGLAPSGLRRGIHVGEHIMEEHCWHASINHE